ncbi:peptidyl-alpha-hydroxyglycine alpha-amidating lyase 1-like [Prorops nasuta]|uniref:peptidyl-alpha-hydroxyglycine alpha-amidating lyase 1-like n=1 Tax=Prorops nasuta TaxID=863751 RepID=UPI0034CFBC92
MSINMTSLYLKFLYFILMFVSSLITISADLQNLSDSKQIESKANHLPDTKFNSIEYEEYSAVGEKEKGSQSPERNQLAFSNFNYNLGNINVERSQLLSTDVFDPNISWDSQWNPGLNAQQISAVSLDPHGNIAVFHRGNHTWNTGSFNTENKFDQRLGPIKQNTIVLISKTGEKIAEWGSNMFYMPHGITIDSLGNYWVTDVALHQVFKFNVQDIQDHIQELQQDGLKINLSTSKEIKKEISENSILKSSLTLGVRFEPGNDNIRFCKPTAVAIQENGDFFVSDGYCNSRIIKYSKDGERILVWGRHWSFIETINYGSPPVNALFVPHSLALAEESNYLFVADRENGRILCYFASNGTFHKEYKNPIIGAKIYSIAYAQEKIYLVNGPESVHTRGFVIDIDSGSILSQFGPKKDMLMPHDLAVTKDESEIYVVELNSPQVYRFIQKTNSSLRNKSRNLGHEPAPLTSSNTVAIDPPNQKTTTATIVLSIITIAVILIVLCIVVAAVLSRCQKRGCLLTVRKRMRWEAERSENFKLSGLFEHRKGKGFKLFDRRPNTRDFSKLNTEPETSDEEHPENSLAKMI